MPKLRPNKSGNPKQQGKVTSYTISVACSLVEKSGFTLEDELEMIVENGKIIIQKKEALN